jgi:lipoprotein-releasing system permease protein
LISIITGISIAGISLGVASLIVVLSVMNGFFEVVRDMLVSFNPHVRIVSAEERGISDWAELATTARRIDGVTSVTPYVEGKVLLGFKGGGNVNKVVIVKGVEEDPSGAPGVLAERVAYGEYDLGRRENRPGIVIGQALGSRLGIFPGGRLESGNNVSLLSAQGLERMLTRGIGFPSSSSFEVRGLYSISSAFDENFVFVELTEAQRLLKLDDQVIGVDVRLANLDDADAVKAELSQKLDPSRYEILTWFDLQRSLYEVMRLEKWGASAVLALIILVAAFNLIGSLTMVVIEKRRDLAVLRALGVPKKGIRKIFLTEGLLIASIGSGVGLIVGLGLSVLQKEYQFVRLFRSESFVIDAYPISIEGFDIAIVIIIVFILCALAALYPAARAASVEPANAVRNE